MNKLLYNITQCHLKIFPNKKLSQRNVDIKLLKFDYHINYVVNPISPQVEIVNR